jgi:hypothetical protein
MVLCAAQLLHRLRELASPVAVHETAWARLLKLQQRGAAALPAAGGVQGAC